MSMRLYMQPVANIFQTISYFYINEETGHGFLIDPGAEGDKLLKIIKDHNWTIEKVLLTHGHFDHSYQAAKVADSLGASCVMNENAPSFMKNDQLNLAARYKQHVVWPKNVELISDHTLIRSKDNSFALEAIATPGHTPDSQIFYAKADNFALVGDMLYNNDIGLTEFPTGDKKQILNSIANKICALPNDTELFTGHTNPMTVEMVKSILATDYGIIL